MNNLETLPLKILKLILTILQWGLLTFSLIGIALAGFEGFKMDFNFSSNGFQNYLSLYQPYSLLFGATFIVLSTNLAIERLGLLFESSRATFKIGNRASWIETANYFIDERSESDPHMIRIFKRNILNIHDFLFDLNYKFSDQEKLNEFFDQFVKDHIKLFEKNNEIYIGVSGIYRDEDYTFSFQSFEYIFVNIVRLEESYESTLNDLRKLFVAEVKSIPSREIDRERFRLAYEFFQMMGNQY